MYHNVESSNFREYFNPETGEAMGAHQFTWGALPLGHERLRTYAKLKRQLGSYTENNRRTRDEFQYTVPSPTSYPYQWLWDSCFHAIVLSHFDTEGAKKELWSVSERQFTNGLLPHIIYWHPQDKLQFDWGVTGTSAITQPPMIAYATWRIFEVTKDTSFLKTIYPRLQITSTTYSPEKICTLVSSASLILMKVVKMTRHDSIPHSDYIRGILLRRIIKNDSLFLPTTKVVTLISRTA